MTSSLVVTVSPAPTSSTGSSLSSPDTADTVTRARLQDTAVHCRPGQFHLQSFLVLRTGSQSSVAVTLTRTASARKN